MAVAFLKNSSFIKPLTFLPKYDTVLICTQMSPSQNSGKFCAEAMFCQILIKLFSHILLFIIIITCKSGVYACVNSMPGNSQAIYNAKMIASNSIAEAVKKAIDM